MSIIFTRVRAQLRGVKRLNRMDNMEPQDDKELWEILGRLPDPTLFAIFRRNVLRRLGRNDSHRWVRNWFSAWRLIWGVGRSSARDWSCFCQIPSSPQTAYPSDSDVIG